MQGPPESVSRLISELKTPEDVINRYQSSLTKRPVLSRLDKALACGRFVDGHGNVERLDDERGISALEVALIHFLVTTLKPVVTVETGFGLGVSALAFLAGTAEYERHKRHFSIDPLGLPGRGSTIRNYIERTYYRRFTYVRERSEYALPRLITSGEVVDCSVSLVDGSHLFEIIMSDVTFLDRTTPVGGCIILDDAIFPAIETVINFFRANKSNYDVIEFGPAVVLVKIAAADSRKWNHFRPFLVPDRTDWTPRTSRKQA